MQTILKIVCDNRGQASMVDDYLVRFCDKATSESPGIDIPSRDANDVVFVKDDSQEFSDERRASPRAQLSSFGAPPNQASPNTVLIFVNPIIISFGPDEKTLRIVG